MVSLCSIAQPAQQAVGNQWANHRARFVERLVDAKGIATIGLVSHAGQPRVTRRAAKAFAQPLNHSKNREAGDAAADQQNNFGQR